jgi:hypothetical protein
MSTLRAVRLSVALLVCALAAIAALVVPASAGSTAPAALNSTVAGTLSTRVVVNRFAAIGRKVVGLGTATTRFTDAAGVTTVTRKHFRLTIRQHTRQAHQGETICSILFLELGELDLTLAGLHAVLHAADPGQPVQLRLTADDTGGILGSLFCQLAQAKGTLASHQKAVAASRQLTKRLKYTTILRARATIYAPNQSAGTAGALSSPQRGLQETECAVLHLVLGPLHLDLLGLVVDLNKVVLDLTAIPGTLLGNIFCQLVQPPTPAGST